jgi:cation diffusion facilitator family transporter
MRAGRLTEPAVSSAGNEPATGKQDCVPDTPTSRAGADESTSTVLVALGANLLIVIAKLAGGLVAGSSAMLSEAAHSLADTSNQGFLLVSLRRSSRPPDERHPFGYGKERYVWAMLAAVGIFVTGACFSMYEGIHAVLNSGETGSYYPLLYGVLAVSVIAEGSSLAKAVRQLLRLARHHQRSPRRIAQDSSDTALTTVLAEDATAVAGLVLAAVGLALHQVTGNAAWEGAASIAIALLLAYVAFQLGRKNMDLLIGQSANVELRLRAWEFLAAAEGVDRVLEVHTMQLAPASVLLAARIDLDPGLDSERVETLAGAIRAGLAEQVPSAAGQIYLDITDATPENTGMAESTYNDLRTDVEARKH